MRYLLDTHTLIWSQDDPAKLSATATATLINPSNDRLLSAATVWEIGIKVALKKLTLSKPFRPWVETAIHDLVLTELPIEFDHIERQMTLTHHHRDPFDRMLAAQALVLRISVISNDAIFDAYGVNRIWN